MVLLEDFHFVDIPLNYSELKIILDNLASDEMVRKVYLGQYFELRKKKMEF